MKKLTLLYFLAFWAQLNANIDSNSINRIMLELESSLHETMYQYEIGHQQLLAQYQDTEEILQTEALSVKEYIRLLNDKVNLLQAMEQKEDFLGVELTKIRYQKGLDLIRLIYEKVLGLDHHFTSIQTYQNITSLSNPNSYPEFQKSKSILEKRLKRENALKLPIVLETNPYLSPAFSLITSMLGAGSTTERESELEEISCILDFTARMNSELATIFYETTFLKENNNSLKQECIDLFQEYVGVIDYHTPLDICRREDDWEKVEETLDSYMKTLEAEIAKDPRSTRAIKQQINLEFAVDRLVSFIDKYNSFIEQGSKYYQKFEVIVSNYPNEENCKSKLPVEFDSLKRDIRYSIDRFNEAYNIAALKGSKLKDLLYGFSE